MLDIFLFFSFFDISIECMDFDHFHKPFFFHFSSESCFWKNVFDCRTEFKSQVFSIFASIKITIEKLFWQFMKQSFVCVVLILFFLWSNILFQSSYFFFSIWYECVFSLIFCTNSVWQKFCWWFFSFSANGRSSLIFSHKIGLPKKLPAIFKSSANVCVRVVEKTDVGTIIKLVQKKVGEILKKIMKFFNF